MGGDDAAYTIFETLNDRGLELSPLDLVKNYLFSRAERYRVGGLKEFEERWAGMMTLLGSKAADSFLKAFWASRHGALVGTKLFGAFKEKYSTPIKAHEISIAMRRGAENYAAIFRSTQRQYDLAAPAFLLVLRFLNRFYRYSIRRTNSPLTIGCGRRFQKR